MAYEDSSGTDDDLPPSHQNRVHRGPRVGVNGRSAVMGSNLHPMLHNDMETQIYHLEQEAYRSVLLAFKAQSDTTITWEKTNLMAELRRELNISEDEHKALLSRVDADENIRQIREWRQSGGLQHGLRSTSQPIHDPLPSPTISASRKKQKLSQSASFSMHPSSALHPQTLVPPTQPSLSAGKRATLSGAKGKKSNSNQGLVNMPSSKSIQYPSTVSSGRDQVTNRVSSGATMATESAEAAAYDPSLIGRKVRTRWPEDNSFYEAVITDYKEGLYSLLYDSNTPNATIEWVNLAEISPEDIRWEGEDPGLFRQGGQVRQGNGFPGTGRGRGTSKNLPNRDFPPVQNGSNKKSLGDIEILRTDILIKEVERIFGANHPDPLEIQKAKKALKEHEQALVDAIARLSDAYDGKTDEGEHPRSHGQSVDRVGGWKKQNYGGNQRMDEFEDEMEEDGKVDGSDGD